MAVYTVLAPQELAAALAAFGLPPPDRVVPEPKGYVNTNAHVWAGGRRLFLRLAEGRTDDDVAFEAEVQRFLHGAGYPVPALLAATDGRPFARAAGRQVMLFAYAAGEELAPGAVTRERCRRIGAQLARLHDLAAAFTADRPNPFGPARVAGWLRALRAGGAPDAEAEAALPLLEDEAARAAALPGAPRGLVHGDLFVDNVLWIGDRVSSVLDWEMSCVDAFAYDLAVALSAWCWDGGWDAPRARALVEGYRERRPLDPDTARALHPYARYAALRFAASRMTALRAPDPGPDRVARKDWRPWRDRLVALREAGEGTFAEVLGIRR